MPSFVTQFSPLAGRILLSIIFIMSGIGKITGFAGTAGWMTSKGLPMADVLLGASIVIELGAAAMIVLGFKARWGAAALLLWMIPVTLVFHSYWTYPAAEQQMQSIMFFKNLGLMGGMLLIMGFGSGPFSLNRK
ncbi:MAG: DoxX family protein [Pseudomonadota bacterium]